MEPTRQCLKCRREHSNKRKVCLCCGAALSGQVTSRSNIIVSKDSSIFISDEHKIEVKLRDLPAHVRHKIEDAVHKGNGKIISGEKRTIVLPPVS